jgi:spermidine synthase
VPFGPPTSQAAPSSTPSQHPDPSPHDGAPAEHARLETAGDVAPRSRVLYAAPLVFASGFCALIYQIVWTREFRLVFGASTAASAAVVAIFIAGLGLGGLVLGRRVERSPDPLRFYALLELAIAALSALTPWLLELVRAAYVASGGTMALGPAGASAVRLLLATLVLGAPTFLMGGTLPAVARAVETDEDATRRGVALVYGVNTLGAVVGCLLATFALLEIFGAKRTLWLACLANALVAIVARALARRMRSDASAAPAAHPNADVTGAAPNEDERAAAPAWLTLVSAGVVGFAFFLMELVWYRLLGPLLGGTVFTFGLILAVALAGIGVGSTLYTLLLSRRRALLSGFALTCLLEAAFMALPYALGDRVALWALLLRPLGKLGFDGMVFGWALVAGLVVFPAALISGLQFPMLIALLGKGRAHVGRDVGRAYAANTVGAIAGSLAGGFGLLPALGALGSWRLTVYTLCGWGALAALWALRSEGMRARALLSVAALVATLLMLKAEGPTAAFRHAPIGVGRVPASAVDSPNGAQAFLAQHRRAIVWQEDGVESAVALDRSFGLAFIVNGKSDGNARTDAPTQVMSGLLGTALQDHTRTAMVIGLGTGSTAGWLAKLPGIERVDVAEIEPSIFEVARRCAPVNEDVMRNPKVRNFQGDARELLAVARERYDIIFSEPSNPYRAGIASLYTRDFYEAAEERLGDGGLFVQWMQAYEVDTRTLVSIYATLNSVFPHVETWHGMSRDMLLIASREPLVHDAERLRARLATEPYARALRAAWRTEGLEGLFGHHVANPGFSRAALRSDAGYLNTDDLSPVEFGFGRMLGGPPGFAGDTLVAAARSRREHRAKVQGAIDWARVDFERELFLLTTDFEPDPARLTPEYRARLEVLLRWRREDMHGALAALRALDPAAHTEPTSVERLAFAEILAHTGAPEAEAHVAALAQEQPTEAAALRGVWLLQQKRPGEALVAFEDALRRYQRDPWPLLATMQRVLQVVREWGAADRTVAPHLLRALARPFAVYANESPRERARFRIALALGPEHPACLEVFSEMEPHVPWTSATLDFRAACYAAHASPLRAIAEADRARFAEASPVPFDRLVAD